MVILIAIPVIAAGLAGIISIRKPHQYKTTTTVVLSTPQTSGSAAAAVTQAVDNFQGALGSTGVATETSQQTGAPIGNVQGGLTSQRRGNSIVVDVTYLGTSATTAPKVVVAASRNALIFLAQQDVTLATAQLSTAKTQYDAALNQLTTLATSSNVVDFPGTLGYYQKLLRAAQDAVDAAASSHNQKALNQAKSALASLTAKAVKLKAGYQSAIDELHNANLAYSAAESASILADAEVTAANSVQLTASPAAAQSRLAYILKRVIPAAVFGFALAVGLVVLLELLQPAAPTEIAGPRPVARRTAKPSKPTV
jgi:hypothetical protein